MGHANNVCVGVRNRAQRQALLSVSDNHIKTDVSNMLINRRIGRSLSGSSSESEDKGGGSADEIAVLKVVRTRIGSTAPFVSVAAAAAEVQVEPVQSRRRRVAVLPQEYPLNLAGLSPRVQKQLVAASMRVGQRKDGCVGRPVSYSPQAKASVAGTVAVGEAGVLHTGSSSGIGSDSSIANASTSNNASVSGGGSTSRSNSSAKTTATTASSVDSAIEVASTTRIASAPVLEPKRVRERWM